MSNNSLLSLNENQQVYEESMSSRSGRNKCAERSLPLAEANLQYRTILIRKKLIR